MPSGSGYGLHWTIEETPVLSRYLRAGPYLNNPKLHDYKEALGSQGQVGIGDVQHGFISAFVHNLSLWLGQEIKLRKIQAHHRRAQARRALCRKPNEPSTCAPNSLRTSLGHRPACTYGRSKSSAGKPTPCSMLNWDVGKYPEASRDNGRIGASSCLRVSGSMLGVPYSTCEKGDKAGNYLRRGSPAGDCKYQT